MRRGQRRRQGRRPTSTIQTDPSDEDGGDGDNDVHEANGDGDSLGSAHADSEQLHARLIIRGLGTFVAPEPWPPKAQATAKAKAAALARRRRAAALARRRRANARNLARRAAVRLLSALAGEVGLRPVRVRASSADVESLARRLDARCTEGVLAERLRAALAAYLENGGSFSTPIALDPVAAPEAQEATEADSGCEAPPPIAWHKLFDPSFRLQSKACMLTFNSRAFSNATWPSFVAWVQAKKTALGARRWAACIEESGHGAGGEGSAAGGPRVFHTHAYFWWTDGEGLRRRNTDDLVFQDVRPRVDVCTCQAIKGRSLRIAVAHGLWCVALQKSGGAVCKDKHCRLARLCPKGGS